MSSPSRIAFIVDGPPPRKNERHEIVAPRNGRPFLKNSAAFETFARKMANEWHKAWSPKIRAGSWSITVLACWPRQRHLDVSLPFGDVDAPVSAVLDALEACGCIDDDVRFVKQVARKAYSKDSPRTVIVIEREDRDMWTPEGDDDANNL
jgi:Holliday junction resolvase RusA-like endonuclease